MLQGSFCPLSLTCLPVALHFWYPQGLLVHLQTGHPQSQATPGGVAGNQQLQVVYRKSFAGLKRHVQLQMTGVPLPGPAPGYSAHA
ncbi:hypothetical protein ACJU26_15015 [Acidithiobacillus sp. M4-SHS-6]|uniref:hypothetical protein n=1 Tax=Acidithiobacillus sp. M4-SHS-6 TaxID=3383024 RepID=UPI0039BE0C05